MVCKSLNNPSGEELYELLEIIKNDDISTVYQPIVSLTNGNIIGYEALSRGPEDSSLQSPDKLFSAAKLYNRTWDLELLCRTKAIERASNIPDDKFLFINVDPYIFKDEKFKRGFTKEFLAKHNISSEVVIFEITEKTSIEDYKNFRAVLNNYIDQGYKIAIDDTGSGYSGLKMLTEIKPHYVKIDMDLIRNINKDAFKQSLIECFVRLSEVTNMKLIAEGIETKEELKTLINLGVYAGQGYFINPPAGTFLDIPNHVKNAILSCNKMKNNKFVSCSNNYIGKIARLDKAFNTNTPCKIIKEYFYDNDITGACIVNDEFPVGLIMKHSLNSVLATQYGVAVFTKRPISLVMDVNPIIVDYYTPVSQVSNIAMERKTDNIYDYIIITKNNKYYGIVTVKALLNYTTMLECNYARQLNPLTGLPGNSIIENKLKDILALEQKCCVLYFDLDNFKVYNDTYGFENGDKVIKFTSQLIKLETKKLFPYNSFIGHIGGDDFFGIIEDSLESCSMLCENIIKKFDIGILNFFNEKDKTKGYIEHIDRKGNKDIFTLTSLSIAGIYGNIGTFSNIEYVGQKAASIKKEAKHIKKSCYIIKEC
ncbi:GGDEF domain-containing protein [Clostridium sp. WILCCON 0269]|uniref:GGDEF domain-containing protein n=1 Tax=Candidatus Clostridium eludens TaxID=3381663 RepID=A0ABW8SM75_9CLOT